MKKIRSFHVIAMAAWGSGFSGGDRIFVELSKRWQEYFQVRIYVAEQGKNMCLRQGLKNSKNLKIILWPIGVWGKLGFITCYMARIFKALKEAFGLKLENAPSTVVYSASDFWMDSVPGFILKIRFPRITWIATFYLVAPSPFIGFREKGKIGLPTLKGIIYWLQQFPIYWMIRIFSDLVCVTSNPDAARFPVQNKKGRVIVVRGGVNIPRKIKPLKKIYDGVFLGRFHPQKGVVELIDIWEKVVKVKPNSKLVMIGDGSLMNAVKDKIAQKGLGGNITLTGTLLDGEKKFTIFRQSKIFMHSAVYDSGGMSCAEGMAWGMPGVSFDLLALKTYYPKGVIKAPIGNPKVFSENVLRLLSNKSFYETTKKDAIELVKKYWDWDKRAEDILEQIVST